MTVHALHFAARPNQALLGNCHRSHWLRTHWPDRRTLFAGDRHRWFADFADEEVVHTRLSKRTEETGKSVRPPHADKRSRKGTLLQSANALILTFVTLNQRYARAHAILCPLGAIRFVQSGPFDLKRLRNEVRKRSHNDLDGGLERVSRWGIKSGTRDQPSWNGPARGRWGTNKQEFQVRRIQNFDRVWKIPARLAETWLPRSDFGQLFFESFGSALSSPLYPLDPASSTHVQQSGVIKSIFPPFSTEVVRISLSNLIAVPREMKSNRFTIFLAL